MKTNPKTLALSVLLSIGIGLGAGVLVAGLNGFITDFFTSQHYISSAQTHKFIVGIAVGYGVLFAAVSAVMIFIKLDEKLHVIYPISGFMTYFVATSFRWLSGGLSNIDCGTDCVDTIVPQYTQEAATRLVAQTLLALWLVGVVLYIAKARGELDGLWFKKRS